jgi:hypothetical protein
MVTERKPQPKRRKPAMDAQPRAKKIKALDSFSYLMKLGDALPEDVIERMPRDGAQNFDHYLDGTPKQY